MQLVHGVINSEDVLVDTTVSVLQAGETYEGDRYRFDGEVVLERSGPFGYTVRVVPHNDLLISNAEMGIVALP